MNLRQGLKETPWGDSWRKIVVEGAGALGVDVSSRQAGMFSRHAEELAQWNRKINLTAITDPLEVAVKHFIDSCAVAPLISGGERILDIGAGGGFPGIPLAVLHRGASVHLIDASRKKVNFLKHVRRLTNAENLSAHHARAEGLKNETGFRQSFDVVVSRAFGELALFVPLAIPFLKTGGRIIAMKGPAEAVLPSDAEYRIKAKGPNKAPALFSMAVTNYRLPYLGDRRSLVVLRRKPIGCE